MLRDYILVRPISYVAVDTFCPALGDSREGVLEFTPRGYAESIQGQNHGQDTAGACFTTSRNKRQTIEIRPFQGLRRVRESDASPEDRAKGRAKEPLREFGTLARWSPQLAYNVSASSDACCHRLASNPVTTNAACAVAGSWYAAAPRHARAFRRSRWDMRVFAKVKMYDERGRTQRSSHLPRSKYLVYVRNGRREGRFSHSSSAHASRLPASVELLQAELLGCELSSISVLRVSLREASNHA